MGNHINMLRFRSILGKWRGLLLLARSLQLFPTLCDPIDGSPPGSPVPGILQARTLEWVAISFSNAWKWKVKSESDVAQPCPTRSNPMDCSLPGSSIHVIFQARVLEWGAIAFSITTPYRAINRCVDVEQETWGKQNDNENMFKEWL